VKWYTHDGDLRNSPRMKAIIADLGMAGYGQAHIMLEILARESKDDSSCVFKLPLSKPTDLKFWSREFHLSPQETERVLDVFEESDLISPWRETQSICAPMLGERVDEWTKRKLKGKGRPKVEPPQNPEPPENGNRQKHENQNEHENKHQHQHNISAERLGSTPESLPSDEAVRWVVRFFKNLGQVPDKKKVVSLFEGRDEEAVKGTCEHWRQERNLEGVKYPFSIFIKEFDAYYNPKCESSDHLEQRMIAASAREQEQAEKDRAAKVLVTAQADSGWVSDPAAI